MKVLTRRSQAVPLGWRPDFRDHETLPDTKVVRTSFFLSVAFLASAIGIAMVLGFREYQKIELQESLNALQIEVDGMKGEHGEKVSSNGKFMEAFGRIEEIQAMRSDQMIGSDLLVSVSAALSKQMVLTQLQYEKKNIVLEGTLDVGADEASALMDEYIEKLKEMNADQGRFESYNLLSIQRRGGQMVFKLSISNP